MLAALTLLFLDYFRGYLKIILTIFNRFNLWFCESPKSTRSLETKVVDKFWMRLKETWKKR
jgi:hypothetical protein